MNEYVTHLLVKERIEEARTFGARRTLLRALRPPRRPIRVRLGLVLVRVGHWMLGQTLDHAGEPGRSR
jgi:hypothetical protein